MLGEYERYLRESVSFRFIIDLALLDRVFRDLFSEPNYTSKMAIAKELTLSSLFLSQAWINQKIIEIPMLDETLLEAQEEYLAGVKQFVSLLLANKTAFVEPTSSHLYQVGLEVARQSFINYSEIIAILLPATKYMKEKPISLYQRLANYDNLYLSSPNPTLVHNDLPNTYIGNGIGNMLQQIRDLRENLAAEPNLARELLGAWGKLANQPDIIKFPALWTAIHIAWGDFAQQQFEATLQLQFAKAAERAYSIPLKLSTLWEADLGTRCICALRLGNLYCTYGSDLTLNALNLAYAIYNVYWDALKSNERLYQRSPYKEDKEFLQGRLSFAIARIIESCVYLSEHSKHEKMKIKWQREAAILNEHGKSRMLREELALAERLPPETVPPTLIIEETRRLERLRNIYIELEEGRTPAITYKTLQNLIDERNQLRLELEQIWIEMEDAVNSASAYVSIRRDESIQWGELSWEPLQEVTERLGPKVALISISRLPDSIFLSIQRAGWAAPEIHIIPLEEEIFSGRYLSLFFDSELFNRPSGLLPQVAYEWQNLGDIIFKPIIPALSDVELVYFFPNGVFHHLPLHALTIHGKPFIEQWAVAYAPSMTVLESTLSRPSLKGSALVMGYAQPNDSQEFQKSIFLEASSIAEYFHVTPLLKEHANSKMLEKYSSSARFIHIACHGEFNPNDPLDSSIDLVDKRFSARDWFKLRLQTDLVTLSACSTNITEVRDGDDIVGLVRSILFAGASSLITTLWPVNTFTTLKWMQKFYGCGWSKNGLTITDKATAFRKATLELKKCYPDPYYWAPFILTGNFQ